MAENDQAEIFTNAAPQRPQRDEKGNVFDDETLGEDQDRADLDSRIMSTLHSGTDISDSDVIESNIAALGGVSEEYAVERSDGGRQAVNQTDFQASEIGNTSGPAGPQVTPAQEASGRIDNGFRSGDSEDLAGVTDLRANDQAGTAADIPQGRGSGFDGGNAPAVDAEELPSIQEMIELIDETLNSEMGGAKPETSSLATEILEPSTTTEFSEQTIEPPVVPPVEPPPLEPPVTTTPPADPVPPVSEPPTDDTPVDPPATPLPGVTLNGGNGNDVLKGGTGDDVLSGGNGTDILSGGAGNDVLFGDNGKDTLYGGTGDDALSGGAGNDTFVLENDFGADVISDFKPGNDQVDVSALGIDSFQSLMGNAVMNGNDTVITTDQGVLTLSNVNIADISAGDFNLPDNADVPGTDPVDPVPPVDPAPPVEPPIGPRSIEIQNASFEADALNDGKWNEDAEGWVESGGGWSGAWNADSKSYDGEATDGSNVGYAEGNGSTLSQTLTETFQSGTEYTLQVDVGNLKPGAGAEIRLYAGDTLLGNSTNSTEVGAFETVSLTIDSSTFDIGSAEFGQPLRIELVNVEGKEVNFDNVRLDAAPPTGGDPVDPVPPAEPPVDTAPPTGGDPVEPAPPIDTAPPADPVPPVDTAPPTGGDPIDPVPPVDTAPPAGADPTDPTPPVEPPADTGNNGNGGVGNGNGQGASNGQGNGVGNQPPAGGDPVDPVPPVDTAPPADPAPPVDTTPPTVGDPVDTPPPIDPTPPVEPPVDTAPPTGGDSVPPVDTGNNGNGNAGNGNGNGGVGNGNGQGVNNGQGNGGGNQPPAGGDPVDPVPPVDTAPPADPAPPVDTAPPAGGDPTNPTPPVDPPADTGNNGNGNAGNGNGNGDVGNGNGQGASNGQGNGGGNQPPAGGDPVDPIPPVDTAPPTGGDPIDPVPPVDTAPPTGGDPVDIPPPIDPAPPVEPPVDTAPPTGGDTAPPVDTGNNGNGNGQGNGGVGNGNGQGASNGQGNGVGNQPPAGGDPVDPVPPVDTSPPGGGDPVDPLPPIEPPVDTAPPTGGDPVDPFPPIDTAPPTGGGSGDPFPPIDPAPPTGGDPFPPIEPMPPAYEPPVDTTPTVDVTTGSGGSDTMTGTGGNDAIDAGAGDDRVSGGVGDDSLSGGDGSDRLSGGTGNDTLDGGSGDDRAYGGSGNDNLSGGTGNDRLGGGSGEDSLSGGDGTDRLSGGQGNDTLDGGSGNDQVYGGTGDDLLSGGDGADRLSGGSGADVVDGGTGDDRMSGGSGNDTLTGGEGNDRLGGGTGNDTLGGGAGTDRLSGGQGNDALDGGAGDDQVYGGTGDDNLSGGDGADRLSGGSGADVVDGGAGDDRMSGGSGNDTLTGGEGNDRLSGGTGNDTLGGGDGADRLSGSHGDDFLDGGDGQDTIFGGSDNDTLLGGGGNDYLSGGSGADTIDGGAGDDTLKGGSSGDIFVFGPEFGNDTVRDFSIGDGDKIDLSATGVADFDSLMANAEDTSAGVVLTTDEGSITLRGVKADDLSEEHFVLADPTLHSGGNESIFALDLSGMVPEGADGNSYQVMVSNLPEGARLSDGESDGSNNWTMALAGVVGLTIALPTAASAADQMGELLVEVVDTSEDPAVVVESGSVDLAALDESSGTIVVTPNAPDADSSAQAGAGQATGNSADQTVEAPAQGEGETQGSTPGANVNAGPDGPAGAPTGDALPPLDELPAEEPPLEEPPMEDVQPVQETEGDGQTGGGYGSDNGGGGGGEPPNQAPTDLTLDDATLAENAPDGTVVGTIDTVDSDSGETFSYNLSDDAGGRFSIDPNTGEITVANGSLLNYESASSHNITIEVTDSAGNTFSEEMTLNLTDANETPTDLTLSDNGVNENAANGTVVGTVATTDPDSGDNFTYSLTDNAAGRFAVNSQTGEITVADGSLLNFESAGSHDITVQVTDASGSTFSETMTLNLSDVNETPTDLSLRGNTVVENAANGTVVGTASAADPDSGETFTYSLSDNAGGRFAIDATTGEVTVADGSQLDFESASSHNVTIQVTDSAGNSYEEAMAIELDDHVEQTDSYAAAIAEHNPVGYWRLSETGGTTAGDETGSVDGTWMNNTSLGDGSNPFEDLDTSATYFDGNNDYVEIPNSPAWDLTEGSVQLRFNADDVSGRQGLISRDASGQSEAGHLTMYLNGDDLVVRLQSASTSYEIKANNIVDAGEWNQVTFTFGEEGMQLYMNGELVGSNDYSGGIDGNNEPWAIGANAWGTDSGSNSGMRDYFEGEIAEVSIFDSQLNGEQIDQLADEGLDPQPLVSGTAGADTLSGSNVSNEYDLIDGGAGNDVISGNLGDDRLYGGGGNDTLNGGAGDDQLYGGTGNDVLNGGDGNDTLSGGTGADRLSGGAGNDSFQIAADSTWTGSSAYNGNTGETVALAGMNRSHDVFDGGDGYDTIVGTDGNDAVFLGDTSSPYQDGQEARLSGIEEIDLGAGDDVLDMNHPSFSYSDDILAKGGEGDDVLWTDQGNDTLLGGTGNDRLHGGSGDDTLEGGTGADVLDGGTGTDTASYASSTAGVNVNLATGLGSGGDAQGDTLSGIENLIGSNQNDTLTGDSGNNVLTGGGGNDSLNGGSGSDTFIFGQGDGSDVAHGGSGGGWTDAILLQNVDGTAVDGGWTISLTQGEVQSSDSNSLTLTDDSAGTITLTDGSQITFDGMERIDY